MKISQLTPIDKARPDIILPLSVEDGDGNTLGNRSITLSQILDAVPKVLVPFHKVTAPPANTVIAETEGPFHLGEVIFDTDTQRFYYAVTPLAAIGEVPVTTYYTSWNGSAVFFDDDGSIRKDCLFRDKAGRLYFYDGESLKSAGGPAVEVISEEDYNSLEAPDPDTIYYIYEDE